ncbi:MAG: shikimate kinase [Bacteroidetes bacterium]|nr:shikimate kinase [Bacteroidota bacterium]
MVRERKEKKSTIFLIGFMGSGKSTLGPILANTIGYQFIDLDVRIEQEQRRKISEIFAQQGEKAFREIEQTMLSAVIKEPKTIISLGGGTITSSTVLEMLKKHGILIYLKSDPEHIYQRLRTKSDRPMLRDENGSLLDEEELKKKISVLLESRKHFYEEADMIIHTDGQRIGVTVDELVKKLSHLID